MEMCPDGVELDDKLISAVIAANTASARFLKEKHPEEKLLVEKLDTARRAFLAHKTTCVDCGTKI